MSIKAQCKECNGSAPAEHFKLHHEYGKMVCPDCFSGKTKKRQEELKKKKIEEKIRPVGWDNEDEYLDKMSRMKKEEQKAQFSKIPGTNNVQCKCLHCKYSFKYDPFRKQPRSCPYCDTDIPKLKTFNLLS